MTHDEFVHQVRTRLTTIGVDLTRYTTHPDEWIRNHVLYGDERTRTPRPMSCKLFLEQLTFEHGPYFNDIMAKLRAHHCKANPKVKGTKFPAEDVAAFIEGINYALWDKGYPLSKLISVSGCTSSAMYAIWAGRTVMGVRTSIRICAALKQLDIQLDLPGNRILHRAPVDISTHIGLQIRREAIGKWLSTWRRGSGLTVAQVASKAGVKSLYVQTIESGQYTLLTEKIRKLVGVYRMSRMELKRFEGLMRDYQIGYLQAHVAAGSRVSTIALRPALHAYCELVRKELGEQWPNYFSTPNAIVTGGYPNYIRALTIAQVNRVLRDADRLPKGDNIFLVL